MSPLSKKIVRLKAELMSDDISFVGYTENLSENNICIKTNPVTPSSDSMLGQEFKLKLGKPTGECLDLNCKIKWSYKTPPHGLTNSIGVEILDQTTNYESFFKTL